MAKFDYELIYLLSENARISIKEVSKILKKSPQRLKYSISTLQKEGVLNNPYCVFDYSYFGLILFRVYFRWGYISEQDKARIISELKDNPYIVAIYELSGEFEIVLEFASPNPSRFNKELKKISNLIPSLNDYKIVLNLVTYVCPRHYLIKNKNLNILNKDKIVGGDREKHSFNQNEIEVMKNILANPKIRLTELAKKSRLNVKTAKNILNNLTNRNIIRGFRYILDVNKINASKSRLFLKFHNLSLDTEKRLMDYIFQTEEIVQLNKTVGDWDMELDLESFDKNKIRNIIIKLKEQFKDVIERVNQIEFYDYYTRRYLPSYLFDKEKQI